MHNDDIKWLTDFSDAAEFSDRFKDRKEYSPEEHCQLLAMGLIGEAGSIVAEFKKRKREKDAYSYSKDNMLEEFGDFLWYFVRFSSVTAPDVFKKFNIRVGEPCSSNIFLDFLNFSTSVSDIAREVISRSTDTEKINSLLENIWNLIQLISHEMEIDLCLASKNNIDKIRGRWPIKKNYLLLFDNDYKKEEQLPRKLTITFSESKKVLSSSPLHMVTLDEVKIKYNGKRFGDSLNDNIQIEDGYRYHDIFHFAYAVYLGWSPTVRKHLKLKRKSDREIDELQDGLRAAFLEEGISAIIFGHAKLNNFFEGQKHIDYDILKLIRQAVKGFEVEKVPTWQWEKAILEGYRIFRRLKKFKGGEVKLKLSDTCRWLK